MKGGPTPRWPGAGPALRAQSDRAAAGLSRAARNLAKHKVAGVREAIETAGARQEYLRPIRRTSTPLKTCGAR